MTTQQVADRLVALSRERKSTQAYRELFAPHASSHEMPGVPNGTVSGLDNLIAKSEAFDQMHREIHGLTVTEPLVYQHFFTVGMGIDVTKSDGNRVQEHEICIYQVEDGKIVDERFVYPMPG